jgi:hypothetical protein
MGSIEHEVSGYESLMCRYMSYDTFCVLELSKSSSCSESSLDTSHKVVVKDVAIQVGLGRIAAKCLGVFGDEETSRMSVFNPPIIFITRFPSPFTSPPFPFFSVVILDMR